MVAGWAWVRSDLRRERRGALVLVLLIGITGAVVLTALAGARRTDTAFERLQQQTDAADIRVQYASSDPIDDEVLDAVRRHPDVEQATPIYFTLAFSEATPYDLTVFSGPEAALYRDVDRFRLVEGRSPDPRRPDEVVVNPFTAEALEAGVGDAIELRTFTPEQLEAEDYASPAGPTLPLTIVGIGHLPDTIVSTDLTGLFGTPAFFEQYASDAAGFGPSLEVLVRDEADPTEVIEAALAGFTFDELLLDRGDEIAARTEDGTRVLVIGLLAFALVAGLGGLVAIAQAIHRRIGALAADHEILSAIGFTRREQAQAMSASVTPIALGGALLAAIASIPASMLMPIGRARVAEPDPGVAIDALVIGLGSVALVVIVLAIASVTGVRVARAGFDVARAPSTSRPARLVRLARAGAPPATQIGVSMALDGGGGSTAVPVRSALVGAAAGVAGVVAALTFAASLETLLAEPARYGWNWSFAPDIARDELEIAKLLAVEGLADAGVIAQREVIVNGEQVVAMSIVPRLGQPSLAMVQGRMPAQPGEIALGPVLADRLEVTIGDSVAVGTDARTRDLVVVGEALQPSFDDIAFTDGVGLTAEALDELAVSDGDERWIVRFDEDVSGAEAERRMRAALPDSMSIYAFPALPEEIANLREVRTVPRSLAAFLVLLALTAVGHTLATSVRQRRRDLGIVRSIGFTRGDVRASINVQSVTTVLIGVVIGVPSGIVIGRLTWGLVASELGVVDTPTVPGPELVILVGAAVGGALLLAALPGRAAVRLRATEALRVE